MIQTLRITGIIAAILAGFLFVFPVFLGVQGDQKIEQLLNSPGAIEKAGSVKPDKTMESGDQVSPLVKQAQAFALYLNPLQPKMKAPAQGGVMPSPRGPVTAQFTLIGTSFYQARPDLSLAFIDEPGKGLRLIRQSSQVGHLVIEQIKDGLIVVQDGQRTFELEVQKSSEITNSSIESFARAEKSTLIESSSPDIYQKLGSKSTLRSISKADTGNISATGASGPKLNAEQSAALEKLVEKLKSLQKDANSDNVDSPNEPAEKNGQIEEIISDFKAERVSEEEAEKLGDLGKELKDVEDVEEK